MLESDDKVTALLVKLNRLTSLDQLVWRTEEAPRPLVVKGGRVVARNGSLALAGGRTGALSAAGLSLRCLAGACSGVCRPR